MYNSIEFSNNPGISSFKNIAGFLCLGSALVRVTFVLDALLQAFCSIELEFSVLQIDGGNSTEITSDASLATL